MKKTSPIIWYGMAGLILAVLTYLLWPNGAETERGPLANNKPIQVFVPPPPPLPEPPPPTTPPEPAPESESPPEVVEEMIEQEPVAENEPPPDELPSPPDQPPGDLGTGITGDGDNGYGLTAGNGNGGGRGNSSGNGGGGSRWGWYAGKIQGTLKSALAAHPATKNQSLMFELKIWADDSGKVKKVLVLGLARDSSLKSETIRRIVAGVRIPAPPAEMPMPIHMRIKIQKF